jgi:cysteine dioxygenase
VEAVMDLRAILAALPPAPDAETLEAAARRLAAVVPTDGEEPAEGRPYGRAVLYADERAELMRATWARAAWCAPHDHGGSHGVVVVLRGRAEHRAYGVGGEAGPVATAEAGDAIRVDPSLVHAMRDGGGEQALVTLHLYAGPIREMRVYDAAAGRTLRVDGRCGAWAPEADEVIDAAPGWAWSPAR